MGNKEGLLNTQISHCLPSLASAVTGDVLEMLVPSLSKICHGLRLREPDEGKGVRELTPSLLQPGEQASTTYELCSQPWPA